MSRRQRWADGDERNWLPPPPKEHKKKPQECSRCHVLYDGPTEHLIRNLYLHGWRVIFSDDGPTQMLCPECYRLHERNTRVTED